MTRDGGREQSETQLSEGPGAAAPGPRGDTAARGTVVGRYVVLSELGAGGMGVVYAAYDPELDRKVALKLLLPKRGGETDSREGRTRLLREARALAKLGHPNVVAIHDVGEHEGSVWLAMEFVEGKTLGDWLKEEPRSWRQVLDVMETAGRGLAAAHAAGLLHRDFKPDNVMVGDDGRVRVMDLGLARAVGDTTSATEVCRDAETEAAGDLAALAVRVTRAGAILGTPAYMAPEQFGGADVDARADVFAWCVTLWEGLYGERPFAGETVWQLAANVLDGQVRPTPSRNVPAWLRRMCLRGLQVKPDDRFGSMQAVLEGLSRGRGRSRAGRWLAAATVLAVLGAGGEGYRRYDVAQRVAGCEAEGASITEVWNDEARQKLRDGLLATGVSYAKVTAEKVVPYFDAQADAWRRARTESCLDARVRERWDAGLLDRATWCLDERKMELDALATELSSADEQAVQKAVTAAAGLSLGPCRNEAVLRRRPRPPEDRDAIRAVRSKLSRADALQLAGHYEEGLEVARAALQDAETLGWPPLLAASRQLEGTLLQQTGAYAEAEAASLAAYMQAARAEAWEVAAAAAIDLVGTVGDKQARHAEGKVWAGHAEVAVLLAGDTDGLRNAVRLHHLANVHQATGAYEEAAALSERTLAVRQKALGPDHPAVAHSLNNLANAHYMTGEYEEAATLQERALGIYEKALGPDHPQVANSLNNLAAVHHATGAYEVAATLFERALAIRERALGPDHPEVENSLTNLAAVRHATGAYEEAATLLERGLSIVQKTLGPDHPHVAQSLDNLAVLHQSTGAYEEAAILHERALAIREKALGPDHPDVAKSLNNLATVHTATGAYEEAATLYERALAIRRKALGPDHPDVARSLASLANVRYETGAYEEAATLHERALAIVQETLGPDHPDVARSLDNLADVHFSTGAYEDAGPLYERALAILQKELGPDHPQVAKPLVGLARVALAQHRTAEAVALAERAVKVREAGEVPAAELAEARLVLAQALVAAGKPKARAVTLARQARDAYRDAGEAHRDSVAEAQTLLRQHGDAK